MSGPAAAAASRLSRAGVVTVHEPADPCLPLVIDSPHSGELYPADFEHAPPRSVVRQAEDTHVARLWSGALRHGATLVEAHFPRAYVDANRALADLDPAILADRWPGPLAPSRKTLQGIGLVWRVARDGSPMYARKLACAEVRARIERCWRPYHDALAAVLDARHATRGAVWLVDCHSMPAVGDAHADDPGRERADFVLGDRDGTTADPAFTRVVADTLRAMGYAVAVNDPYKGVEIVRRHGRPRDNRHALQVEVKRTLYMDERTLEPNAGYARLATDLDELAGAIAAFVRDASRPGPRNRTGQAA